MFTWAKRTTPNTTDPLNSDTTAEIHAKTELKEAKLVFLLFPLLNNIYSYNELKEAKLHFVTSDKIYLGRTNSHL
jgi:hypothetical protein